jgi:hypothetical protein
LDAVKFVAEKGEGRKAESGASTCGDFWDFFFGFLYEIVRIRIRIVDALTDTHLNFYFLV